MALAEASSSTGFQEKPRILDKNLEHGTLQDSDYFSKAGVAPPTSAAWRSIQLFFSMSWFHRLWTAQELVIGSSKGDAVLICGDPHPRSDKWLVLDPLFLGETLVTYWLRWLYLWSR